MTAPYDDVDTADAFLDAVHDAFYSDPNCDCDQLHDPCAKCTHPECAHHSARGCRATGCECFRFLTDDDCPDCGGTGDVSVDVELAGGRVVEDDLPCPACRGTGEAGLS